MKYFLTIIIPLIMINTTSAQQQTSNPLNGTWAPTHQEMGGNVFSAVIFAAQQLIIADSNYTVIAESIDKGTITYNENKMDIYGKEGVNSGKHFTAIFKYENNELTICYNLAGTNYPEGFETKGSPMYFLSIFKKEQTK